MGDILLTSMKAEKLTACHHPSLIPLVGSNPIDANSSELMTTCELYKTSSAQCNEKIVLMQIRSAIVRNKSGEFWTIYFPGVTLSVFKMVIILSKSIIDII